MAQSSEQQFMPASYYNGSDSEMSEEDEYEDAIKAAAQPVRKHAHKTNSEGEKTPVDPIRREQAQQQVASDPVKPQLKSQPVAQDDEGYASEREHSPGKSHEDSSDEDEDLDVEEPIEDGFVPKQSHETPPNKILNPVAAPHPAYKPPPAIEDLEVDLFGDDDDDDEEQPVSKLFPAASTSDSEDDEWPELEEKIRQDASPDTAPPSEKAHDGPDSPLTTAQAQEEVKPSQDQPELPKQTNEDLDDLFEQAWDEVQAQNEDEAQPEEKEGKVEEPQHQEATPAENPSALPDEVPPPATVAKPKRRSRMTEAEKKEKEDKAETLKRKAVSANVQMFVGGRVYNWLDTTKENAETVKNNYIPAKRPAEQGSEEYERLKKRRRTSTKVRGQQSSPIDHSEQATVSCPQSSGNTSLAIPDNIETTPVPGVHRLASKTLGSSREMAMVIDEGDEPQTPTPAARQLAAAVLPFAPCPVTRSIAQETLPAQRTQLHQPGDEPQTNSMTPRWAEGPAPQVPQTIYEQPLNLGVISGSQNPGTGYGQTQGIPQAYGCPSGSYQHGTMPQSPAQYGMGQIIQHQPQVARQVPVGYGIAGQQALQHRYGISQFHQQQHNAFRPNLRQQGIAGQQVLAQQYGTGLPHQHPTIGQFLPQSMAGQQVMSQQYGMGYPHQQQPDARVMTQYGEMGQQYGLGYAQQQQPGAMAMPQRQATGHQAGYQHQPHLHHQQAVYQQQPGHPQWAHYQQQSTIHPQNPPYRQQPFPPRTPGPGPQPTIMAQPLTAHQQGYMPPHGSGMPYGLMTPGPQAVHQPAPGYLNPNGFQPSGGHQQVNGYQHMNGYQ
ncbi:hypothetical protein QBC41DRAFT_308185 [Cercophora samala]|uniref:Uncharacterized protein n=1 Tax=Cercophora samala TaxID=330535 RepID=A0AA39YTT1_9PEZI|nr:hypothetical protein QBC41DRAFT_308185 [Cercophora samala]